MQKKYIIGAIVAIVGLVAFMMYRNDQQRENLQAYHQKTYSKLVEIARKSPRGGMAQMGRALKKYYLEHKTYPKSLADLYPKYIPDRDFIQRIQWKYTPKQDDFLLSKSVTVHNRIMIARLDKRLIPKVEGGLLLASGQESHATETVAVPKGTKQSREELLTRFKKLERMDTDRFQTLPKDEGPVDPRIVKVQPAEKGSGLPFDDTFGPKCFVWKDSEGHFGFGDTHYLSVNRYSFYQDHNWITIKQPTLTPTGLPSELGIESKESVDKRVASKYQGRYLVWKDQQGHLGLGNLEYPTANKLSGLKGDHWLEFDNAFQVSGKNDMLAAKVHEPYFGEDEAASLEDLAKRNHGLLLVWKDDDTGTKGFGNMMYPTRSDVSVFKDDKWEPIVNGEAVKAGEVNGGGSGLTPPFSDEVAKKISTSFLVWKDKNGNKAFGNFSYPSPDRLSYVCVNGTWKRATASP